MQNHAMDAIQAALHGQMVFCKFLAANDTGLTGGHQRGIYISKPAISILFDTPGRRGEIKDRWAKIRWQGGIETNTRFIYYGQKSRNEYRITNFGRGFPFLDHEYTGALFVFVKNSEDDYQGFVLNSEEEINQFLDTFAISPTETNQLIDIHRANPLVQEKVKMREFIRNFKDEFPSSDHMAMVARVIHEEVYDHIEYVYENPDQKLIDWIDLEYRLFRELEHIRYGELISNGFNSVEEFIAMANQVLNRRKSRAGKSLEHHLSVIFDSNSLKYQAQAITEGNKRPDFLFPSQEAYRNLKYPTEKLVSLAAKTTCKDRWRQIINEADRLRDKPKYLCTLQQGISPAQLDEMHRENVVLVVPEKYILTYPKTYRDRIWTLKHFVGYIREIEGING